MADHEIKTISYRRVVELSHPIAPDIPFWPGDPPVEFQTVAELDRHGYFLRYFSMSEHSGTHLASPATFDPLGSGPEYLHVDSLILPSVVFDATDPAGRDPDYTLSPNDVAEWENRHGPVAPGSLVLLSTGWHQYWSRPDRFINLDGDGTMHTPGFSPEAARFLLQERGAAGLGIDTHGVDAGADASLAVSRMALARSAVALECLNNLDQLPPTGATVIVGRLQLVGGSGSPVAALALTP